MSDFRPSIFPFVICSNIKALKLAPNKGFKYLSVSLVKKKFNKLFRVASLVVYVEVNTAGALKGIETPTAVPGLVSIGNIF
jgi:hypothetical protein